MISLLTGVMRSGKSLELIKRIKGDENSYLIIKPSIDSRDKGKIKSRAISDTFDAMLIDEDNLLMTYSILSIVDNFHTVYIDEVQFFSPGFITRLIKMCELRGTNIVASGLIEDFKGKKFISTQLLMYSADEFSFLTNKCFSCSLEGSTKNVLLNEQNKPIFEGDSVKVEGQGDYHFETLHASCLKDLAGNI